MTIRPRLPLAAFALLLAPSAARATPPADATVYVDTDIRTSRPPAR